jgi:hypothetical protein
VGSGATGNLINKTYVQKHNIQKDPLERPVLLKGANGAEGAITYVVNLGMELYNSKQEKHEENIRMYVANIDTHDVILGTPWLIKHNPSINWASYNITFTQCPEICKQGNKQRHTKPAQWAEEDDNEESAEEHIESWCTRQQHEVWISKLSEQQPMFARISGLEQTSYVSQPCRLPVLQISSNPSGCWKGTCHYSTNGSTPLLLGFIPDSTLALTRGIDCALLCLIVLTTSCWTCS